MTDDNAPFGFLPVGEYLLPQAGVRELRHDEKPIIDTLPFLPSVLRSLESPTHDQQVQVLRRLAVRIARIVERGDLAHEPGTWYMAWMEEFGFDEAMEVATVILGALGVEIVGTGADGSVSVRLNPWDEDLRGFLMEHFVPYWHYLSTANEDSDDEFEYDLDDRVAHGDELAGEFGFEFFDEQFRCIDLDILLKPDDDILETRVVAVRKEGISSLAPARDFGTPMDRIMHVLIGVLYFFQNSGEGTETGTFSVEELRRIMEEEIKDDPEDEFLARSRFEDDATGAIEAFELWQVPAIIGALGVTVTGEDDGAILATLRPPQDLGDIINEWVGSDDDDEDDDDDDFLGGFHVDIVDPVSLGIFEHLYFGPDDDGEEDDEGDPN